MIDDECDEDDKVRSPLKMLVCRHSRDLRRVKMRVRDHLTLYPKHQAEFPPAADKRVLVRHSDQRGHLEFLNSAEPDRRIAGGAIFW